MNATADTVAAMPPGAKEPWRRRLLRTLLYGSNVDRAAKARARIGLAMLMFTIGFSVIAGRLVMFAASENHNLRKVAGQDAVATARPDILDRNGQILATDVRTPSLFGEPHRIIDVDEASELLTAVDPGARRAGTARAARVPAPVRLAQARDHRQAAHRGSPAGSARHRLSAREQAGLSERRRSLARDRSRQHRQPGHRRHREVARQERPRRPAHGGPGDRPAAETGRARGRSARAARAAR